VFREAVFFLKQFNRKDKDSEPNLTLSEDIEEIDLLEDDDEEINLI
jgi:hypothetical protein